MRTASLIATFIILVGSVSFPNFDPSMVHYMETSTTGNMLFRGNAPLNSTDKDVVDWDVWVSALNASCDGALPSSFYLVDLCLLSMFNPYQEQALISFFNDNPSKGEYINWITVGNIMGPELFPLKKQEMACALDEWQLDQLPTRIDLLHDMMESEYSIPYVFYIHCEAGKDRTGEFSGAYAIKYMGYTYDYAIDWDEEIAGREIECPNLNALQWYCYYLKCEDKEFSCTERECLREWQ